MIIAIDGPDCAGKTTLASNIHDILSDGDQHKVDRLHAGPPRQHPLDEYERPLYERRGVSNHVIMDRWDLGEHVYPAIFNRPTKMDAAVARHIELFKRAYGVVELILNPRLERLVDCMQSRPKNERDMTSTQLQQAHDAFAQLPSTGNHRLYFSLSDPVDSLDQILDLGFGLEEDAAVLRSFVTYVGQARPRFVIFGERRGTGDQYLTMGNAPAFGPYPSTSGHYLLTHLDVPRFGAGLANACDVDDPRLLWEALGQPPAVALGVNAHDYLTSAGVPHGAMPHPQYVRRFYNHYGHQYASAVIETVQSQENMLSWRP